MKTRLSQTIKLFTHFAILLSVFGGLFLASAHISGAQSTESNYKLLAPIPTIEKTTGITLVDYMKGLFTAAIGLAIVLAVVEIVIGGIGYVAAAIPSSKEGAKKRISGAVGGLLLILVAYVLLQALNPKLLNVGLNLEKVAVVGNTSGSGGVPPPPPEWCLFNQKTPPEKIGGPFKDEAECNNNKPGGLAVDCKLCSEGAQPPPTGGNCPATNSEYIAGDNSIRAQLEAGGVQVKTNNCTSCGQEDCTSVYGLPSNAVSGLIALKASCNCEVFVSGGTEAGHITHDIGKPIVDLRHTPSLDAYLKNVVCTKSGRNVYGNAGNYYWDEDSAHFHVTYGISQC